MLAYVYLALSVLLITCFALGYKIAAHRHCELRAVNLWMNVSATAILAANFVLTGPSFNVTAAVMGVLTGICTYFATLSFFYHIRGARLASSWTVIGLAVAFPVAASILLWHEHPTTKQWLGLALLPIAFYLSNSGRKATEQ